MSTKEISFFYILRFQRRFLAQSCSGDAPPPPARHRRSHSGAVLRAASLYPHQGSPHDRQIPLHYRQTGETLEIAYKIPGETYTFI